MLDRADQARVEALLSSQILAVLPRLGLSRRLGAPCDARHPRDLIRPIFGNLLAGSGSRLLPRDRCEEILKGLLLVVTEIRLRLQAAGALLRPSAPRALILLLLLLLVGVPRVGGGAVLDQKGVSCIGNGRQRYLLILGVGPCIQLV